MFLLVVGNGTQQFEAQLLGLHRTARSKSPVDNFGKMTIVAVYSAQLYLWLYFSLTLEFILDRSSYRCLLERFNGRV